MDKLIIIICCFLWILESSALPIINPDESLIELCPPDSVNRQGNCTCLPCQTDWDWPICDKFIVEVERGNEVPGTCCPRYECRDEQPVCSGSKLRFYKENKCTLCDPCEPLAVQCKEICQLEEPLSNCLTDDEEYKQEGETWTENNGCTRCACLDGKTSCQTYQCNQVACSNPISVEGECCLICPDELDESGLYIGHSPMGGTTKGPTIIGGDDSAEEDTTTEISTLIPNITESSYSGNSLNITSESSTPIPDTSESTTAYNFTNPTESTTSTSETSESFSTPSTNSDSSSEPLGDIVSSESPDLRNVTDDVEISSSDSSIDTTRNPTTYNDPESITDSTTSTEPANSMGDHITKSDMKAETTKEENEDMPTEISFNKFSITDMTDNPITLMPAAVAVAPESTSQVKDTNDTEDPLAQSTPKTYADVPQEQIKTDYTWAYVMATVIIMVAIFIIICIYKNYFVSKNYKYNADSTATVSQQPREIVALLNPVRK
ncbi:cell wall integrity and stress response component 4 [Drosophila rhopaloa]|uniref:VWFC domain-containing protein n=1 Tax=Drosophila rhopaloa TaxID=1041015 RepID=A0ABM5JFK5_DRORH|nr:cell wall integrity and stress response component 4 [Drosophila rhopaloa]